MQIMQIFGSIGWLLGFILWGAFYIFKNFGLAIIVFTIIVKAALFPFTLKQQKSMAGSARLAKKQKELREKYGNNRMKLQEELNKLNEKEGVKPMGGCLTMIVPMLVLFGVFYAVAYPLTNTLHIDSNHVNDAVAYINQIPGYASATNPAYQQIALLRIFPNISQTETIQGLFNAADIEKIHMFSNGFDLFGSVDLLQVPADLGFWSWYLLFPILCFLSNVGSQFVMQKVNQNNQMNQQKGCMKVVMYALPLFSAYIAYSVPAAMSFYWIISALLSLIQSVVLAKLLGPVQINAKNEARHVALMFQNEAKVPYVYAPQEKAAPANNKNKNKKKK